MTILEEATPDGERGRVMAVLQAAMSASSVLSMGFAGIAGDVIGIRAVFLAAGAITGLGCLVAIVGYPRRRAAAACDPGEMVSTGAAVG